MPIVFSDHAKIQLKRRGISQKLVKNTLLHSKQAMPSFRGRKLHRSMVGDRLLEVVTRTEEEVTVVITAYFLEG